MASLGNQPEELMIEILTRLPPESLCRSKSVCKSWYALIHSLQHTNVLVKRLVTTNSGNKEYIFSILKFPLALDRSVSVFDVHFTFHEDLKYLHFRGHSHGLVCLSDLKDIFLCNPTTGELRKLPPSILLLTVRPRQPDGYDSSLNAVGFGYDVKSRDFKVVRIVDFVEGPGRFYPTRVEIYDLSKDRWREIETPLCGYVFWTPSFEMFHQGKYYWWAYVDDDTEIIMSFDLSDEVFDKIPVPESFEEPCEKLRSMGVLNGSIVLFHYPPVGNKKTFDIWEMDKDECGGVSWSKLFTIDPIFGIEPDKPLLFVSSEELLMEADERNVILYNIKTQRIKTQPIKELPIKGYPNKYEHDDTEATFFVESLLSVKVGNSVINYEF